MTKDELIEQAARAIAERTHDYGYEATGKLPSQAIICAEAALRVIAPAVLDMAAGKVEERATGVTTIAQWDATAIRTLTTQLAEAQAEIARLREARWFYLGYDCSEPCRFGIDECITEDFEWNNIPQGDHVLQISGARPVPDMWVALHYYTEAEKDERDDDEPYTYTVHETEEAARAALGKE